MATLLYIEASPRHEQSYSLRLADAFLDAYRERNPDDAIDHLNLLDHELPGFYKQAEQHNLQHIQRLIIEGKGIEPVGQWGAVVEAIDRLKAADRVLLSSPIWNYSIPYKLNRGEFQHETR